MLDRRVVPDSPSREYAQGDRFCAKDASYYGEWHPLGRVQICLPRGTTATYIAPATITPEAQAVWEQYWQNAGVGALIDHYRIRGIPVDLDPGSTEVPLDKIPPLDLVLVNCEVPNSYDMPPGRHDEMMVIHRRELDRLQPEIRQLSQPSEMAGGRADILLSQGRHTRGDDSFSAATNAIKLAAKTKLAAVQRAMDSSGKS